MTTEGGRRSDVEDRTLRAGWVAIVGGSVSRGSRRFAKGDQRVRARAKGIARGAVLVLAATVWSRPAAAQMFSYDVDRPQAVQSLSIGYHVIDFRHDGDSDPSVRFDYGAPAYGVVYTRPNVRASLSYGRESRQGGADLRLLQAAIMTWGDLWRGGRRGADSGFSVPIALLTNYRRVAPEGSEDSLVDAFNVTVLGIGAGLSFAAPMGKKLRLAARAVPGIGLALRAFGDSAGSSYLLDGVLQLDSLRLIERFGLSASYGFRAQAWNVGASELIGEELDDLFDYSGTEHVISIGFNW